MKKNAQKITTARQLIKEHGKLTDEEFGKAIDALDWHQKDLLIVCPAKRCRAPEGEECKGLAAGTVHIGRRVRRMLKGIR